MSLDKIIRDTANVQKKSSVLTILSAFITDENLKNMFRYNEFICDIEYSRKPCWAVDKNIGDTIDDDDEVRLKIYLAKNYNLEPPINLIHEAVVQLAREKIFHPVKDYLLSLKWDGEERLDNWLPKCIGADRNSYTCSISRKLICASISRIFDPGCQFDYLIVLEGKQGTYKTTLIRTLAGEWYAPLILSSSDKDIVDIMRGKWILEIEDMKDFKRQEIEHIKAFLSRKSDRIRLAYRRNTKDFPRQCIIIGTMNPEGNNQYLKDSTGNRRFLPIECRGTIDIEWIIKFRDQIFAEGMEKYKSETLYFTDDEAKRIAIEEQVKREQSEAWQDIVWEYLHKNKQIEFITPTQIFVDILKMPLDKINIGYTGSVGRIMRKLQWLRFDAPPNHTIYYLRPGFTGGDFMKQYDMTGKAEGWRGDLKNEKGWTE